MVCWHYGNSAVLPPFASEFGDTYSGCFAEKTVDGSRAERHDHFGLDEIDLGMKVRQTSLHFVRCGRTISKRLAGGIGPAFKNIRDVNPLTSEASGFDNFCEQLAGSTDKGFAL